MEAPAAKGAAAATDAEWPADVPVPEPETTATQAAAAARNAASLAKAAALGVFGLLRSKGGSNAGSDSEGPAVEEAVEEPAAAPAKIPEPKKAEPAPEPKKEEPKKVEAAPEPADAPMSAKAKKAAKQAAAKAVEQPAAEPVVKAAPPPPAAPELVVPQGLPDGWVEHFDKDSGKSYYHNASKGVTQWNRPSAPPPPPPPAPAADEDPEEAGAASKKKKKKKKTDAEDEAAAPEVVATPVPTPVPTPKPTPVVKPAAAPVKEEPESTQDESGLSKSQIKKKRLAEAKALAEKQQAQEPEKTPTPPEPAPKKKKGKAAPAPVPVPVPEPVAAKKSRRGGRNKKASDDGPENTGDKEPTGMDLADMATEKDEDFAALKERLVVAEEKASASSVDKPFLLRADLDKIMADIDTKLAAVQSNKISMSKTSKQPSHLIEQSLMELEDDDPKSDMIQEIRIQLDGARAFEAYNSMNTKLKALKVRAADAKEATNGPKTSLMAGEEGTAADGAREEAREAAFLRRLEEITQKKDLPAGSKVHTKTMTLDPELQKYLFTPPFMINKRLESELGVVVDTTRPAKGKGKGGGPGAAKDLIIAGLSAADVNKGLAAVKALDFSGAQTKELEGQANASWFSTKAIEQEFNVYMIFVKRSTLTILGTKGNTIKAMDKVDKETAATVAKNKADTDTIAHSVQVDGDIMKAMNSELGGWRTATNTQIRVVQSEGKVLILGKTQKDVDSATKKVEDFVTKNTSELVLGEFGIFSEKGSKYAFLGRKFREMQDDAASSVQVFKKPEGLRLIGTKKEVETLKAKLLDILGKANSEPTTFTIKPEQSRVFPREAVTLICQKSGAEVLYQPPQKVPAAVEGEEGTTTGAALLIFGDEGQAAAATKAIEELIKTEGTIEILKVSDDVMKLLLAGGASRIKDLESAHADVSLNLNRTKSPQEVTIVGSAKGTKDVKRELAGFAAKVDKDIADSITTTMTVDAALIPRIIGTKGANLKALRESCNVQVNIDNSGRWKSDEEWEENATTTIDLKGIPEEVAKAKEILQEIIDNAGGRDQEEAPKPTKKANAPKKKAEEYKGHLINDFPDIGGEAAVKAGASPPRKAAGAWGKKTEDDDKDKEPAEEFPAMNGNGKAAAKAEEEEEAEAEAEEEAAEEEEEEADEE